MLGSADYLQQLIRLIGATDAVKAAWVGPDTTAPEPAERIAITLVVQADAFTALAQQFAGLGDVAFSGPAADGWRIVTADGLEFAITVASEPGHLSVSGLTPLFNHAGEAETAGPPLDLVEMAGRFWSDLHRAAIALERGWLLSAHGELERCRQGLLDLYRLALAPGEPGRGWSGAEAVPGLADRLAAHADWLVAPLERRGLQRSAHRLASTYESLMLPLCSQLGLTYPMAMRNLAFRRLNAIRPDPAPGEVVERPTAPAPQEGPRRLKVKGKIRR